MFKKVGIYVIKGVYMCGNEFRFEDVDYEEAKEFAQKVKQAVIYDCKGRRLYEYFSIDK